MILIFFFCFAFVNPDIPGGWGKKVFLVENSRELSEKALETRKKIFKNQ